MAVSKLTELLGTQGLASSDSILVYNSNTFKNSEKIDSLGISNDLARVLASIPKTNTINDIYSILTKIDEYSTIPLTPLEEGSLDFIFVNNQLSVVGGEGFDTIIFLSSGQIIGYTVLVNPVGYSVKVSTLRYSLKKEYTVDVINIHIDSSGNSIRVGEDKIDLVNKVKLKAQNYNRSYSGESNENYITKRDIEGIKFSTGNYDKKINSILNSSARKNIFTDTFFSNLSKNDLICTKLSLKKNIILPEVYNNLTEYQIGFYSGDIVLYLWNKQTPNYAIISLTKTLEDIFEDIELRYSPLTYTPARSDREGNIISNSEIYTIPTILGETLKIKYFAGNYAIVENSEGIYYIFDVNRQSGEKGDYNTGWVISDRKPTPTVSYYEWSGENWIITKKTSSKVYTKLDYVPDSEKIVNNIVGVLDYQLNYLNTFSIDRLSLSAEPVRLTALSWKTYKESLLEFPDISNTYVDSKLLLSKGYSLVGKAGDWCIFLNSNDSSYIYSNLNKSIKIGIEEPSPIIINNQVLLTYSFKNDSQQYVLYNEPGFYITSTAARRIYNWSESRKASIVTDETRDSGYYIYTPSQDPYNVLQINNGGEFISSPIAIQSSFLSYYRRNTLPRTLNNFRIIGAIGGIIYYKIGNTINYL